MKKQIILDGELWDYYIYDDGRCQNIRTNNFLKGSVSQQGYRSYYLRKGKKAKNIEAHRLVAIMFLDNPNNLPVVHHKDANKLNNNLDNLQWVTYSENALEIKDQSYKSKTRPPYEYYSGDLEGEQWAQYHNTHLFFSNKGRLLNKNTNRILKCHIGKDGYCYYSPKLNGKTKKIMCHRGVYEAFNDIYLEKTQQIVHIDGDKNNNNLENLRLVTAQENCQYRSDKIIEKNDFVIGQYDLSGNLLKIYKSQAEAARVMNVADGSISNAVNNKCLTIKGYIWRKISKQEVQRLSLMNVEE